MFKENVKFLPHHCILVRSSNKLEGFYFYVRFIYAYHICSHVLSSRYSYGMRQEPSLASKWAPVSFMVQVIRPSILTHGPRVLLWSWNKSLLHNVIMTIHNVTVSPLFTSGMSSIEPHSKAVLCYIFSFLQDLEQSCSLSLRKWDLTSVMFKS